MRSLPLFALAFFAATSPVMAADEAQDHATTLDVNAQVDVKAAPDLATLTTGVLTTAPTADAAMKENTGKMTNVFEALKKAGIADKDVQTSGINISPQYVYEDKRTPKITAYQAINTISIKVRDMKKIGPVLDGLVAQGINEVSGPAFSVENPDVALDDARKQAVAKARSRADLYATATGLKITKIRNISESVNTGNPAPYPMMAMARMNANAKETPVASGEVSLSVTVNITYELGQ